MTDIAEVIGWKFSHQAEMATKEGVITEFPGGIPTQADQDIWTAEYEAYVISVQYIAARLKSVAEGGYGTPSEQFEIIGEQGIGAYQSHIAAVKAAHPKPV